MLKYYIYFFISAFCTPLFLFSSSAQAKEFCNETSYITKIAVGGYQKNPSLTPSNTDPLITGGWLTLNPGECKSGFSNFTHLSWLYAQTPPIYASGLHE